MARTDRISVGAIGSPVIEAGPRESREAVVFVHGNPGSSHDWERLVEGAGEFGRAVAFDMPGFGQADKPRDFHYEVPSYASFIEGAREQLGIDRVHLVLHDFGGAFGLVWGLQHPEQWASLVLINVGINRGYTWHKMAKRWRTPVLGEVMMGFVPRFAWRRSMQDRKVNPKGLPPAFVDEMYDNFDRATRRTVLALYRATDDPGAMADAMGPAFSALNKPALVVWGAKDPYIDVQYAERQGEFFDVQDVVILPDSGHWPFQDDPQAVAQAVLPFLAAQLSGAAATA